MVTRVDRYAPQSGGPARTRGVAPEVSAQRACERSGERGRGAQRPRPGAVNYAKIRRYGFHSQFASGPFLPLQRHFRNPRTREPVLLRRLSLGLAENGLDLYARSFRRAERYRFVSAKDLHVLIGIAHRILIDDDNVALQVDQP